MSTSPLKIAVLISGNGSNLQALIDNINLNRLNGIITAVISSNPNAYGLKRAEKAGIATANLSPKDFASREEYDLALTKLVSKFDPDLIVLAGFMQIVGPKFLKQFKNLIINIHPSLLPLYPGLNTHEQALKDKRLEHGCSIHYVTEDLDAGPIIAQAVIGLTNTDSIETLKQKVHQAEHFLYPTVINWFAHKRVTSQDESVLLDGMKLPGTGIRFYFGE